MIKKKKLRIVYRRKGNEYNEDEHFWGSIRRGEETKWKLIGISEKGTNSMGGKPWGCEGRDEGRKEGRRKIAGKEGSQERGSEREKRKVEGIWKGRKAGGWKGEGRSSFGDLLSSSSCCSLPKPTTRHPHQPAPPLPYTCSTSTITCNQTHAHLTPSPPFSDLRTRLIPSLLACG